MITWGNFLWGFTLAEWSVVLFLLGLVIVGMNSCQFIVLFEALHFNERNDVRNLLMVRVIGFALIPISLVLFAKAFGAI